MLIVLNNCPDISIFFTCPTGCLRWLLVAYEQDGHFLSFCVETFTSHCSTIITLSKEMNYIIKDLHVRNVT